MTHEWNMPTGYDVLRDPALNKSTAFTRAERERYRLRGLLPVQVVDQETGAAVSLSQISWMNQGAQSRSCQPQWEDRGSSVEWFTFSVPIGQLQVSNVFDNEWLVQRKKFTLMEGVNDLVVEAIAACGIRITLFDGEVPLPLADLPRSFSVRSTIRDHRVLSWSNEVHSRLARLSAPDTYTVTIGRVVGFQPIAPMGVTVQAGEFYELEVELVRE